MLAAWKTRSGTIFGIANAPANTFICLSVCLCGIRDRTTEPYVAVVAVRLSNS